MYFSNGERYEIDGRFLGMQRKAVAVKENPNMTDAELWEVYASLIEELGDKESAERRDIYCAFTATTWVCAFKKKAKFQISYKHAAWLCPKILDFFFIY